MAVVDFAALTAPVTDSDPCGPDLDLSGDADFMNFMARAEGLVPTSYFSGPDGAPFDRSMIDLAAELKNAQPFLEQSRDLRLLALLAKFAVLSRDLESFVVCLRAMAALMENRWDEVHPRGEGGDFTARMAAIETLNDTGPVVIPLQFIPLAQSKRAGAISYRSVMIANGEVTAREGEDPVDRATVDKALMEADLDGLIALRGQIEALQTALLAMANLSSARAGSEQAVNLDKTTSLAGKVFGLLNEVITKRDPSAAAVAPAAETAEPETAAATSLPGDLIRSNADVAAALTAIDRYFCRSEPSNPALLLVRQAQQLMGKSFLEVMQILVPTHVGQAKFRIGGDHPFEIPIESLSPLAAIEHLPEPAYVNGGDGDSHSEMPHGNGSAGPQLSADSRQQAFALLEQIGAYYRIAEPSSPISFITERARSYVNRDFLALLKDLLPASASD
jgi:type VI secretion system protein ImpA